MTLALPSIVSAAAGDLASGTQFDAVIAVYPSVSEELVSAFSSISAYTAIDKSFGSSLTLVADQKVAGGRLILAPTGSLTGDSDDVRKFQEITKAAMKRAIAAGAVAPLFYFPANIAADNEDYSHFVEVSLLGALAASFDPIDVREHYEKIGKNYTVEKIGFHAAGVEFSADRLAFVNAVEVGRRVAKGRLGVVVLVTINVDCASTLSFFGRSLRIIVGGDCLYTLGKQLHNEGQRRWI